MRPILFLLLITTTYLSLPAVAQQKTTDNATMKKRYLSAKNQFRTFEREHGNFIQTNNVNMHYLSWGDPKKPCLIWIHGSMNNVSENDPMPFEKENQALQQKHPRWISYIVYQNTEHNIHYQHPERFTKDLIRFMKRTHPSPASQAPQ
ncbi:alpha/beta fold hydrolase [Pedobacter antarcticus]|uniref:alpha/beta fold hydrolase n=1 Tax=Pedobacter antarcticus TaxID=34086 RepID=UPI001C55F8E3|nr:alpha/beta hydrolase [Pedobacter antarcticus]